MCTRVTSDNWRVEEWSQQGVILCEWYWYDCKFSLHVDVLGLAGVDCDARHESNFRIVDSKTLRLPAVACSTTNTILVPGSYFAWLSFQTAARRLCKPPPRQDDCEAVTGNLSLFVINPVMTPVVAFAHFLVLSLTRRYLCLAWFRLKSTGAPQLLRST
jgi:hypothetical protein